jgi:uncharacterized membrane protein YphA (DoxX/SURF4 family)
MKVEHKRLLVLRVALGILFCLAGLAKLCAPEETAALLADKGIPEPRMIGLLGGALECTAGIMLLFGIAVSVVARILVFAIVMIATVFHLPLLSPPGVAHMKAVALGFDLLVVLGLSIAAHDAAAKAREALAPRDAPDEP